MKIFVISDTHFGHANIIRYCDRPFATVDEMNRSLIENWNSVVSNNDIVIHVGDFAFLKQEALADIRTKLNGKIWLIRGNHDKSTKSMLSCGIDFVANSMIFADPISNKICLFQHYPIEPETARENVLMEIGCDFIVHGHAHNNTPLKDGINSRNVSCENLNYTPKELHTIF